MTEQEVEAGIELLKALKNTRDLTLLDAIRIDAKCSEVSWVNIVQQLNLFGLVKYHWLNGTISQTMNMGLWRSLPWPGCRRSTAARDASILACVPGSALNAL